MLVERKERRTEKSLKGKKERIGRWKVKRRK